MSTDPKEPIPTSSIVMKAIDATTFSELQAFTKDLESRPADRLLRDVADLVRPSESKAQIVSYVIATKYRHAGDAERRTMLNRLDVAMRQLQPGEQRERVEGVIERLRREDPSS